MQRKINHRVGHRHPSFLGKMPLAFAEASAPDLAYGTSAHFPDLAYGTSAESHSPGGGARSSEPLLRSSLYTKDPISSLILRGTDDKP